MFRRSIISFDGLVLPDTTSQTVALVERAFSADGSAYAVSSASLTGRHVTHHHISQHIITGIITSCRLSYCENEWKCSQKHRMMPGSSLSCHTPRVDGRPGSGRKRWAPARSSPRFPHRTASIPGTFGASKRT
jgi:hypothetical protein